jgi:hypothetical protein
MNIELLNMSIVQILLLVSVNLGLIVKASKLTLFILVTFVNQLFSTSEEGTCCICRLIVESIIIDVFIKPN